MAHVLVLGAGFGGISAALEAHRLLGAGHRVTLVDEGTSFRMGLGKLWVMDGRRRRGEGHRPLAALRARGIDVVHGRVGAIDPEALTATVDGKTLKADGIVVALGARLAPEATSGFAAVHNLYEEAGAEAFGHRLRQVRDGTVLIQVCGMPFKCPPAPYEAAMLAAEVLRKAGSKAKVHLATPEPHPLPVAPPEMGGRLLPMLHDAGVTYHPGCKPTKFEQGRVHWENGQDLAFDAAAAVPVHKVAAAVEGSSLAGSSGFIPVDPATLQTRFPRVHAVGDVCAVLLENGKAMPKAGVLAERQGRAAAAYLVHDLTGKGSPKPFEAIGTCYIETGGGKAVPAEGHFFDLPNPSFRFKDPSAAGLKEKERFETDRLREWFGPG